MDRKDIIFCKTDTCKHGDIESITESLPRCDWCTSDPLYISYHDNEWGREVMEDRKMFEFIVLESAQAGLSWLTILRRREGYRKAFADFDVHNVAQFTEEDVERLMLDSGIIRNRKKIEATISNAVCFISTAEEFGSFCNYMRSFLPNGKPLVNRWKTLKEIPVSTPLSDAISKDMKKRGFKFFGTIICYAHLQAVGYVNDHLISCFRYSSAKTI
jgi:3-methyladenine DNA glycosylase